MIKWFRNLSREEFERYFNTPDKCLLHLLRLQMNKKCPTCNSVEAEPVIRKYNGTVNLYCPKCGKYLPNPKKFIRVTKNMYSSVLNKTTGKRENIIKPVEYVPFNVWDNRLPIVFRIAWAILSEPDKYKTVFLNTGKGRSKAVDAAMTSLNVDKILTIPDFTKYGVRIIRVIEELKEDFLGYIATGSDASETVPAAPPTSRKDITVIALDSLRVSLLNVNRGSTNPLLRVNSYLFYTAARQRCGDSTAYQRAEKEFFGFSPEEADEIWNKYMSSGMAYSDFIKSISPDPETQQVKVEEKVVFINLDDLRNIYFKSPQEFGVQEVNWSVTDFMNTVEKQLHITLKREEIMSYMSIFNLEREKSLKNFSITTPNQGVVIEEKKVEEETTLPPSQPEEKETLLTYLSKCFKQSGMTQKELSKRTGITASKLSTVLNPENKKYPTLKQMRALTTELNLSHEKIYRFFLTDPYFALSQSGDN